jgi:hypothetical protein
MKTLMITFALLFCSLFMLAQQAPVHKIKFESFTRGYKKTIEITSDSVVMLQSGNVREGSPKEARQTLQAGEWEQLIEALEGIRLPELPQMEAAGKGRARDAALHSTLTITTATESYSSPAFDNYKAPAGLMGLMEKIREIEGKLSKEE